MKEIQRLTSLEQEDIRYALSRVGCYPGKLLWATSGWYVTTCSILCKVEGADGGTTYMVADVDEYHDTFIPFGAPLLYLGEVESDARLGHSRGSLLMCGEQVVLSFWFFGSQEDSWANRVSTQRPKMPATSRYVHIG